MRTTSSALFALAVTLAASNASAQSVVVDSVDFVTVDDRTEILLRTDGAPVFRTTSRTAPPVLIVDLLDASVGAATLTSPGSPFLDVKMKPERDAAGAPFVRALFRFDTAIRYDVTAEGKTVRVSIWRDGPATPTKRVAALDDGKRPTATDVPAPRLAQGEGGEGEGATGASTDDGSGGGGKNKMTYIGFKNTAEGSRVFARMDTADAKYSVKKEGQNLMVLEIEDAYVPLRNNKNHLDATYFESPVKMITPGEVDGTPKKIRIVIEMKEDVPFEDKKEGREIVVFFKK
jgi:hypothetical protein